MLNERHIGFALRRAALAIVLSGLAAACSMTAQSTPTTAPTIAAAARPTDAALTIVSPARDAVVTGATVTVDVNYTGPLLVPGAEAKKLDDYHLHYFLDEDATAYLSGGKAIPTGNPHIMHSAAKEITFQNVAPGRHTLMVVMSGNNHVSVAPPLTDSVIFSVQ